MNNLITKSKVVIWYGDWIWCSVNVVRSKSYWVEYNSSIIIIISYINDLFSIWFDCHSDIVINQKTMCWSRRYSYDTGVGTSPKNIASGCFKTMVVTTSYTIEIEQTTSGCNPNIFTRKSWKANFMRWNTN